MKQNKEKDIRFIIGTYDDEKQKGNRTTTLFKKSQVARRASTILRKNRHVWLKVIINRCPNEVVAKTMKDLKFALAAFIEQPLVDYLQNVKHT